MSNDEKTTYEKVTLKQHKEYKARRDAFLNNKKTKQKLIKQHQSEISKLEKEIEAARPKLPEAITFAPCPNCDIYSLMDNGYIQEQDERVRCYNCAICGKEEQYT